MSRKPRNFSNSSYFHVMTQGINKMFIFDNSTDVKHYIKLIYSLTSEYSIKIIAYCIMSNHTHMLVKIQDIQHLSTFMHKINTKYALYYNKKYNRVGPVFRDRFKAQDVFTERQLNTCINYIFNNPVKAGICKNPEDYPYSNYFKLKTTDFADFAFIEDEEDKITSCYEFVEKFLRTHNISKVELKRDKELLKELILIIKTKYEMSYRKIEEVVEISRETLRKILK